MSLYFFSAAVEIHSCTDCNHIEYILDIFFVTQSRKIVLKNNANIFEMLYF